MVTRRRLRTTLTGIGLYIGAALLIGYFGINAYTGAHGLKAKQDLSQQMDELSKELAKLKLERASWGRRARPAARRRTSRANRTRSPPSPRTTSSKPITTCC